MIAEALKAGIDGAISGKLRAIDCGTTAWLCSPFSFDFLALESSLRHGTDCTITSARLRMLRNGRKHPSSAPGSAEPELGAEPAGKSDY
jgi:hypothetical protein